MAKASRRRSLSRRCGSAIRSALKPMPKRRSLVSRAAAVAKASRKPIREADRLIRLAQQQSPRVRRHHPAVEIGDDPPPAGPSKTHLARATQRLHRGFPSNQSNSLIAKQV